MKSRSVAELRQAIIEEAQQWIGTPFHHEARIKGAGVDCLMFLAEVYERVGIIPHVVPSHYPPDWFRHQDYERYLEGLVKYAREIPGPPLMGDIALFKFGRTFSHGTIVVEWPRVIHAYWAIGVVWGDAEKHPLQRLDVRFFSPFVEGVVA